MKKAYFVGIAGGTASGKSTLCEKLEKVLGDFPAGGSADSGSTGDNSPDEPKIKAVHMDKYFKPAKERPVARSFVTGKMYSDYNHPQTVDMERMKNDLEQLRYGEYDIVIIEGLLTLWDDDIYAMLDLKLFIDCESDERIVRRINRNMQKGLTMDEITGVFLDMVRFRHNEYVEPSKWRADIILNGSHTTDVSMSMITGYIKNNYKKQCSA